MKRTDKVNNGPSVMKKVSNEKLADGDLGGGINEIERIFSSFFF